MQPYTSMHYVPKHIIAMGLRLQGKGFDLSTHITRISSRKPKQ